jgi:hypothetical protein
MRTALSYLVAARRCEMDELGNLARTCDLIRVVSELVHRLQHERGVSNLYLASKGQQYAQLLAQRVAATDTSHTEVLRLLDPEGATAQFSGGARLYTKIALALHALDGLQSVRKSVSRLQCNPETNAERYKKLVNVLLALIFEAADVAVDPDVSRLLIALFHLMQGKEFAGLERATGGAAFAAGCIGNEQKHSLEFLIEMQDQALQRFESFAGRLQREWQALQASMPLAELQGMRRSLLESREGKLNRALSDPWFSCCTLRMDELHNAEMHIASVLQQLCQEKISKLQQDLDAQEQVLPSFDDPKALSPLAAFTTQVSPGNLVSDSEPGAVGPHLTQAVVDMLQVQSARLQALTEELAQVRTSLDERKLIERAKGILMMHRGLDEESAYRFLRRSAMDHNRRIVEVAQSVLSLAEVLPGPEKSA